MRVYLMWVLFFSVWGLCLWQGKNLLVEEKRSSLLMEFVGEMRWEILLFVGGWELSKLRFFSLYEKEGKKNNFSASSVSASAAIVVTTTVTLAFFTGRKSFGFWVRKKENQFLKGPAECRVSSEWENAITTSYLLCLSSYLLSSIFFFIFLSFPLLLLPTFLFSLLDHHLLLLPPSTNLIVCNLIFFL